MKHFSSILFLPVILLLIGAVPSAHAEDDPACVRMPCLGKCISKEDAAGKAFPMFCMRQSECYKGVDCTRLDDGTCGWRETAELKTCLAQTPGNPLSRPVVRQ